MKNIKRLLILLLTATVLLQCFIVPVSAKTRNPFETFIASDFDEVYDAFPADPMQILEDRVGRLRTKSWLCYKELDFGKEGATTIEVISMIPAGYGDGIELRLDKADGPVFATIPIAPSSDWGVPVINTAKLPNPITGVHDLYITGTTGKYMTLSKICFYKKVAKQFDYNMYTREGRFSDLEGDDCADVVNMLYNLGLIMDTDDGLYRANMMTTREDFAYSIYRIFEKPDEDEDEEIKPINTGFNDVEQTSKYAEAIAYLSRNGIMNGESATSFRPYAYITYAEALTVAIRVLGFKDIAEENGGFPNGYVKVATQQKLINSGVDPDAFISRADIAYLLNNVIEADYLTATTIVDDNIKYEKAEGIMGLTQKLFKGSGVVDATPLTSINLPDSGIENGQIYIDGKIYNTGNADANALVGYECDFWYEEDNRGERTLRVICPQSSTEILEIKAGRDEILQISNSKIKYVPYGKEREEVIDVTDKVSVIYNGVAADASITALVDSEDNFSGTIQYVENGNGSKVLFIDEYHDYKIESLDPTKSLLKLAGTSDTFELANEKNFIVIKDQNGDNIALRTMTAKGYATIYHSKNTEGPKLTRIYISDRKITGTVTRIEQGKVYIDDQPLKFSNNYSGVVKAGQNGEFTLNVYGDVVAFAQSPSGPPVIGLYNDHSVKNTGFETIVTVKLLTAEGKLEMYPLANRVIYNGLEVTDLKLVVEGTSEWDGISTLASEDVIRYKINSNGELSFIDTIEEIAKDENDTLALAKALGSSRYYDRSSGMISGVYHADINLYLPGDSLAFNVFGAEGDKERIANTTISTANAILPDGGDGFRGTLYSSLGNKYSADIVVRSRTLGSLGYEQPIIVDSIGKGLSSDGDTVSVINGLTPNGSKSTNIISSEYEVSGAATLGAIKKGDIIRVQKNNNEVIDIRYMLNHKGEKTVDGVNTVVNKDTRRYSENNGSNIGIYGVVVEVYDNFFVIDKASEGEPQIELVPKAGEVAVCFKRSGGEYVLSTGHSAQNVAKGDMVFAWLQSGDTKQIIIYDDLSLRGE